MLLAYEDHGPGPVVVLLHGFPLNRSMWTAQMKGIGSTYRLIAPDLRGHGGSDAVPGPYPMEQMADDVSELLDKLHISGPVVLGGLSMGGYVALAFAARHPARVRALMLMDTRASADPPDAARHREELAKQVEALGNPGPVVEGMLPKLFSPFTRQHRADLIPPIRRAMEKTHPRAVAGALRGMALRTDRTGDLPGIKVPALVLVGADDVITPPAEVRTLADALPDARFALIPDAGHLAPYENPGAVNPIILEFIRELS